MSSLGGPTLKKRKKGLVPSHIYVTRFPYEKVVILSSSRWTQERTDRKTLKLLMDVQIDIHIEGWTYGQKDI